MSRFSYLLLPFLSLRCLYVGWLGLECGHVGRPPSAYVHHYLWPGKATILERLCPCYLSPLFRWPSITTDLKHCSVVWFGGEGDDQLWGSGRGAIAGCHCSVLLLWGGSTNFGSGRGAIAGWRYGGGRGGWGPTLEEWTWCRGGERGDDQLWGSWRGAIAGCHFSLVPFGGRVTTNFGGGGCCWVPLQGAIVVCYGCPWHFFFTLITQKLVLLSGVYAGIIWCWFFCLFYDKMLVLFVLAWTTHHAIASIAN